MWEQVKRTMVESAREVCSSVREGGKNPKSVWWNDVIKAAFRRCSHLAMKRQNKDAWKRTEKRRERSKGVYIRAKKGK